jgi:succinyl-CoA synthetase beta subunit
VSWLIADHERIAEIDINPLFVSTDRVVAADALIVLRKQVIMRRKPVIPRVKERRNS